MLSRIWAVVAALALASLACAAVDDFITLEGPEDRATDAVPFAVPTRTAGSPVPAATGVPVQPPTATVGPGTPTLQPEPSATLALVPPAAGPDLPYRLDEAGPHLAEAALRADFDADPHALGALTRYVMDVQVTANRGDYVLTGRAAIRFTNTHGVTHDDLVLMLWPNHGSQYRGEMTLDAVRVRGQAVTPSLGQNGLVARLPLGDGLAPGEFVDVEADFTVRVFSSGRQGLNARFGVTQGVMVAPTFYPLIPRWVGGAWQAAPAPPGGDTTNSDTAYYAYRVTAPDDVVIVASGTVVAQSREDGTQTQVLVTGPMRDLALTVGPLEHFQAEAGGVTLNAYLLPDNAREAEDVLAQAAAQVENLQARVGPYPFEELDIVDAPGAFGGIEYPGLVYIGVIGDGFYQAAVVHEVGHQWFYSLIGDDQLLEPWLDEAAASYTEVLYAEAVNGERGRQQALDGFRRYLEFSDYPELPIGLPVGEYPDPGEYGLLVYGKGALFFDKLRETLGDDVFFAFLQSYYNTYRYGFANSQGFQSVAEGTCGCDLDDLFDLWVYEGGEVN